LLIDLLTPEEERADELTGHLRFDIGLLAAHVVTSSIGSQRKVRNRDAEPGPLLKARKSPLRADRPLTESGDGR
jgi:hypothetical protein